VSADISEKALPFQDARNTQNSGKHGIMDVVKDIVDDRIETSLETSLILEDEAAWLVRRISHCQP